MGNSIWLVHVLVFVLMILKSVPTYGYYVEWSEVCCEKGGSGVEMVKANVLESSRMYMVDVEVPGINNLNIEIKKKEREVWIRGERTKPDDAEENLLHVGPRKKWLVVAERGNGQFWRRFLFPINALMDRVEFRLQDGVLHIVAPLRR